ncbi:MAG TPA: type I-MYXAN CRISPR-associated protein Cas6/Cmx6 [Gammaproteobacteria bacterium]|nr:type I-MYXAN CRISPR-associated protein Cas6/Cmx6 [Gammaproteobacteria bacterium]
MFWEEDKQNTESFKVPEDIVDLRFKLKCHSLPIDHAQALSTALIEAMPWMDEEDQLGIHAIHVAGSSNGWFRPDNQETEVLHLSHRTRLALRIPQHRLEAAKKLTGQTLDIAGHSMRIGESSIKKLSSMTTVFARYMVSEHIDDEAAFLQDAYHQLQKLGIKPKKMMSGLTSIVQSESGPLKARTLMVAELDIDQSIHLQQQGLGPGRKLGCGIFIPHKGIEAVTKTHQK